MSEPEAVNEPNSRADSIIKQLKEARFRRGKFGLPATCFFWAIQIVAIALVRFTVFRKSAK